MKISNLLKDVQVEEIINKKDVKIDCLSANSKKCKPNSLFFCINGFSLNGQNFVLNAIDNGAVAVVCSQKLDIKIPQIIVTDVRKAMSIISANFFGNFHKKLKIIGIVGTNGKSSCAYIIKQLLDNLEIKSAMIGTNEIIIDKKVYSSNLTTPDPIELHELFKNIYQCGARVVVMEVSAHSIYLNKVYGIDFYALALTNVASDHLDFFKTKQLYEATKKSIFYSQNKANLIVNLDDRVGQELNKKVRCLTYSLKHNATIKGIYSSTNCDVKVRYNGKIYSYANHLIGKFNVQNQLLSILVLLTLSISITDILMQMERIREIKGRLNVFKTKNSTIIVDYAHTSKSLEELLKAVKQMTKKNVVAVVGCPGNRDENKRREFGKILNRHCAFVYLTQDNPKYENPFRIMREMSKGIDVGKYLMVENRAKAINLAHKLTKKENFVLVIIGKGIEEYQDINGIKVRYSDIVEVKKLIR